MSNICRHFLLLYFSATLNTTLFCRINVGVHGFKEDRKRAQKWLNRAQQFPDDALHKLTDLEKGNIKKYLNTMSPSSNSVASSPSSARILSSLETVPEQIDVNSNSTGMSFQRGGGHDHDHDSISGSSGSTLTTRTSATSVSLSSHSGSSSRTHTSSDNSFASPHRMHY